MRAAFTLIEILVVVILLAILAAIVIMMFNDATHQAKVSARKTDIKNIMEALETYRVNIGDFPASLDDLEISVTAPGPLGQPTQFGPWLKDLGNDPIDLQPYSYSRISDTAYVLEGDNVQH